MYAISLILVMCRYCHDDYAADDDDTDDTESDDDTDRIVMLSDYE